MVAQDKEAFNKSFHSITGRTLGEIHKNLHFLLKETDQNLIDFELLEAKTPLEEILKVNVLLYYKNTKYLLKALRSDNAVVVEKILKSSSWFIEQALQNISAKELITDIFPHLSYVSKIKLLNKLALQLTDEIKADEIFDNIRNIYSLYLASLLLPACSKGKIMASLDMGRIEITPKGLLTIIKRHPSITEAIFQRLYNYDEKHLGIKYELVFKYLLQNDTSVYLNLIKKHKPEFRLGIRATKTFIQSHKENCIENSKKYYKRLNPKRVRESIKDDFQIYYKNLFPKSLIKLEENTEKYLLLLKSFRSDETKAKIFFSAFKNIYGTDIWEYPNLFTENIIGMMFPADRQIWMKARKRPKQFSEETWTSFLPIDESLPLIKRQITLTSSSKERSLLVKCLIKTCKINYDKKALIDVLKYVMEHHRNENISFKRDILAVLDDDFDSKYFELDHWQYIYEFIDIMVVNNQYDYVMNSLLQKYILFCCQKNISMENGLMLWTKLDYWHFTIFTNKQTYKKNCLLLFPTILKKRFKDIDLIDRYLSYLSNVYSWNLDNPKNQINVLADNDITKMITDKLSTTENHYHLIECVISCIMFDFPKAQELNLLELILKNSNHTTWGFVKIIRWLQKNHYPEYLKHFADLIKYTLKSYIAFHQLNCLFSIYFDSESVNKIKAICKEYIIDENEDMLVRRNALFALLHVTEHKEFLEFIPSYYPVDLIPKLETEEEKNFFQLQTVITSYLLRKYPSYSITEPILKFCKGDYLKIIHKALYHAFDNINEQRILDLYTELYSRAVSVRKHGIYFVFKDLPQTKVYEIFERIKADKNSSIRKNLFKSICFFFLRNQTDQTFALLKDNQKIVDADDIDAFSTLVLCKRVSKECFQKYALFTWHILQTLPENTKTSKYKSDFLNGITKTTIKELPYELCQKIITKYLFKAIEEEELKKAINEVTSSFIIYGCVNCTIEYRLKLIFEITKNCYETEQKTQLKNVLEFIQNFCSKFTEKDGPSSEALSLFINMWNDILNPQETFDEYILLRFTLLWITSKNNDDALINTGKKIAELCDSLNDAGLLDVNILSKSFNDFKSIIFKDAKRDAVKNEIILIESILNTSNTTYCAILALLILPTSIQMHAEVKNKYESIINKIKQHSNSLIKVNLNHYMRKIENDN